jgi:hypothetical protein
MSLLEYCALYWRSSRLAALMMKTVITSETSAYFYETARRSIPEGYHFQKLFYQYSLKCDVFV